MKSNVKYTVNIGLDDGVWSKPMKVNKTDFDIAKRQFDNALLICYKRVDEDKNWKIETWLYFAPDARYARVCLCITTHKEV